MQNVVKLSPLINPCMILGVTLFLVYDGQGASIYLIYDAFVGCDHKLASIWTMVWDISFKTTFASATTSFELGL